MKKIISLILIAIILMPSAIILGEEINLKKLKEFELLELYTNVYIETKLREKKDLIRIDKNNNYAISGENVNPGRYIFVPDENSDGVFLNMLTVINKDKLKNNISDLKWMIDDGKTTTSYLYFNSDNKKCDKVFINFKDKDMVYFYQSTGYLIPSQESNYKLKTESKK